MKVLIYSANFAPEPTGIGKYSGEMAEWLAKNGHEIRVVAAPPYYPNWQIDRNYRWPPYRKEDMAGCKVWRAPIWVPRNPSGIKRVIHLATFGISSVPVMLLQCFWRPDVVITVAPSFMCAPAGWLTARMTGATAWLHVQDFEVDVAFRMGFLRGRGAQGIVRHLERWMMRRFDAVSTISQRMLNTLKEKGVRRERCRMLPNWADIQRITPLSHASTYRKMLGIPAEATVCLFSGSLGQKQGLMVIPEAARLLQPTHADIHYVVCGDGVMKQDLEEACRGLRNVHFLPLQPIEQLPELLGLADIHLLPQSPEAEDLVLPSKLTGMLSSGRPIIATCRATSEIASIVRKCGVVVPPEDAPELAKAIAELATSPERRLAMGIAARHYAEEQIGRDSVLERLVQDMIRTRTASHRALSQRN